MKRLIISCTVVLGFVLLVNASAGPVKEDCYCWAETACYDENNQCYGTVYCEGDIVCDMGWGWVECDGDRSNCIEPV